MARVLQYLLKPLREQIARTFRAPSLSGKSQSLCLMPKATATLIHGALIRTHTNRRGVGTVAAARAILQGDQRIRVERAAAIGADHHFVGLARGR
jgi:hypothetical protein